MPSRGTLHLPRCTVLEGPCIMDGSGKPFSCQHAVMLSVVGLLELCKLILKKININIYI